jgi:hypothetical protein
MNSCSFFLFPAKLLFGIAGPEEEEEPSGGNVLRLIQIRLTTPSFERSRWLVKTFCSPKSPISVRKTQSAFHPRAQRTVDHQTIANSTRAMIAVPAKKAQGN